MWNKITSRIKPRVISRAITKIVTEAAIDSLIDDSANSTAEFLSTTTPNELLSLAIENKSITDTDSKNEWLGRLRKIVITARRTQQLDGLKEQSIVNQIQAYDVNVIIPLLRSKAVDKSNDGDDTALQNFGFLVNSSVCKQWLIDNLNQVKQMVIEEIVRK